MRRRHLEALRPVCPVCLGDGGRQSPLALANSLVEEDGDVLEGLLQCSHPGCLREYPIFDGVPLLIPGIRAWMAANHPQVLEREDLSPELRSLVGDCLGPGSPFDTVRQQVASYAWDHYGDLDPAKAAPETATDPPPGSAVRLLESALELAGDPPPGPVLDLGCAVGRTTFALAERREGLVLGVDLHFAMLRLASRVLRRGQAVWERRRVGLVYDRREAPAVFPRRGNIDFWACDATALPFPPGTFTLVAALNLLDCVASPREALASLATVLAPGGEAVLATPYDWSPSATPVEAWLGGHSQRGPDGGAAEPVLEALLTPGAHPASVEGLEITGEAEAPWRVRLHDRSAVEYRVQVLALRRR